jgi:hypothetical protein
MENEVLKKVYLNLKGDRILKNIIYNSFLPKYRLIKSVSRE